MANQVGGMIARYGLEQWWLEVLDSQERAFLEHQYCGQNRFPLLLFPIASGPAPKLSGTMATPAGYLAGVLRSLRHATPQLRRKVVEELERRSAAELNPIARHLELSAVVEEYYRGSRGDEARATKCENACLQLISLAPEVARAFRTDGLTRLPRHVGYECLAALRRRQKRRDDASALDADARGAGWLRDPHRQGSTRSYQ